MEKDFKCPVCRNEDWETISTKNYKRDEIGRSDAYNRIRLKVLFDIWFGGRRQIDLEIVICNKCGFLCYRPRPTEQDIEDKYDFLNQHPEAKKEHLTDLKSDKLRSRELYGVVKPFISGQPKQILDFGGGKGRLLHKFVEMGHQCAVLDLVDKVIPGVEYVGRNLSDIPEQRNYDLIICSHVLEHLADPASVLMGLKQHISKNGYLFIEVPSEIWRQPPPRIDPVTHINFFTTDSIRTLLQVSGFLPLTCKYETFTRPNGMIGLAVKAVGVLENRLPVQVTYSGSKLTNRLIYASVFDRMMRLISHPRLLKNLLT